MKDLPRLSSAAVQGTSLAADSSRAGFGRKVGREPTLTWGSRSPARTASPGAGLVSLGASPVSPGPGSVRRFYRSQALIPAPVAVGDSPGLVLSFGAGHRFRAPPAPCRRGATERSQLASLGPSISPGPDRGGSAAPQGAPASAPLTHGKCLPGTGGSAASEAAGRSPGLGGSGGYTCSAAAACGERHHRSTE